MFNSAFSTCFKTTFPLRSIIPTTVFFGLYTLPSLRPLASILLQNHNISEKACDKAAEIFEENAKIIGILNDERRLSFDNSDIEVFEEEEIINDEPVIDNPQTSRTPVITNSNQDSHSQNNNSESGSGNHFKNSNPIPHNIPLKNKLPAQLLLPSDVSSADFDFIISYIGLIRNQY